MSDSTGWMCAAASSTSVGGQPTITKRARIASRMLNNAVRRVTDLNLTGRLCSVEFARA